MNIIDRSKTYITSSTYYFLGMLLLFGLAIGLDLFFKPLGLLVMFCGTFVLFIKLHFDIHKKLSQALPFHKLTVLGCMVIISVALMFIKIGISEQVEYHKGCINRIDDSRRFLNYLAYSLWSTIVLWELYYRLLKYISGSKMPGGNFS